MTSELQVGGAIAYWTVAKHTEASAFVKALESQGISETAIPKMKTTYSALRGALVDNVEKPLIVRPLADQVGYTVVEELQGSESNKYETRYSVLCDKETTVLQFLPAVGYTLQDELMDSIRGAFHTLLHYFGAATVSKTLVECATGQCCGTTLRESGSVYWIPSYSIKTFEDIADCAARCAVKGHETKVHILTVIPDSRMAEAVLDGIGNEVQASLENIIYQVDSGNVGPRGLESKIHQLSALEGKVKQYETLLSRNLSTMTDAIQKVAIKSAEAILRLSASAVAA